MRWGFGWELGPFEIADAIGIQRVLDVARDTAPELLADGVPAVWLDALAAGRQRRREGEVPPAAPAYEGVEISVKGAGGPTCLTRPIERAR